MYRTYRIQRGHQTIEGIAIQAEIFIKNFSVGLVIPARSLARSRGRGGARGTNSTELITKEFTEELRSRGKSNFLNDFLPGNCPAVNSSVPVIFRKAIRDRAFKPFAAVLTADDRPSKSCPFPPSFTPPPSFPPPSPRCLPPLSLSLSCFFFHFLCSLRFSYHRFVYERSTALNSLPKRRSAILPKKKGGPSGRSGKGRKG